MFYALVAVAQSLECYKCMYVSRGSNEAYHTTVKCRDKFNKVGALTERCDGENHACFKKVYVQNGYQYGQFNLLTRLLTYLD